ncbi:hypothetical protein B5M42_000055 [Paenibacillus athensensis]|uniref:hypothetical protein n=1 Tax=Paenibacillus athensensis TaxID=1967502 RepID=UPI00142F72BA|nr:hypothetical protein [Paenibacillus athensensis]MCD1257226.1 hypothetical protein [Paenibacillus athensensis]
MTKAITIFVVAVLIVGLVFYALRTNVAPSVVTKSTRLNNSVSNTTVDSTTGAVTAVAP